MKTKLVEAAVAVALAGGVAASSATVNWAMWKLSQSSTVHAMAKIWSSADSRSAKTSSDIRKEQDEARATVNFTRPSK
jgi:hypothetical protein